MSGCKHCQPLESTGETEPLLTLGDTTSVRIKGNRLIVESYGSQASRSIDFCPVCGESLRPFGPGWVRKWA